MAEHEGRDKQRILQLVRVKTWARVALGFAVCGALAFILSMIGLAVEGVTHLEADDFFAMAVMAWIFGTGMAISTSLYIGNALFRELERVRQHGSGEDQGQSRPRS